MRQYQVHHSRSQSSIESAFNRANKLPIQQEFNRDLAKALASDCIPFYTLRRNLGNFLRKYIKLTIPSDTTAAESLPSLYTECIDQIKEIMNDQDGYFVIDETQDRMKRPVVNVLVAPLNRKAMKPMLVSVSHLNRPANHITIQREFMKCCSLIWGEPGFDKLIVVVSDQVSYNLKAFRELPAYQNLHHVTCVIHALHGAAECVRLKYEKAEPIVVNLKKVLKNSPERVSLYYEETGLSALPPTPIKIRWGTYIQSAMFISENFDAISKFIEKMDEKTQASKALKKAFKDNTARNQLRFITHYSYIVHFIKQLKAEGLELENRLAIIDQALSASGTDVKAHLVESLRKNPAYNSGWIRNPTGPDGLINPQIAHKIRYLPLLSVAVERSFSKYKRALSDTRCSLSESRIAHELIISYNGNIWSNYESIEL